MSEYLRKSVINHILASTVYKSNLPLPIAYTYIPFIAFSWYFSYSANKTGFEISYKLPVCSLHNLPRECYLKIKAVSFIIIKSSAFNINELILLISALCNKM